SHSGEGYKSGGVMAAVAVVDGVVEGVGSCRQRKGEGGKGGCEGGAVREVRPPEKSSEKMEAVSHDI
ncbi:hypothetical protein Tco_0430047, partial [Tanacetum coccineum]